VKVTRFQSGIGGKLDGIGGTSFASEGALLDEILLRVGIQLIRRSSELPR
jgi:hypothetical protein